MNIIQNTGMPDLPAPNYQYITRTEDALRVLPEIEKYDIIEIDTEDTSLDPLIARTVLIQIGVLGKAFVFDVRDGNVDASIFKPMFESNAQLKLLQNAAYDYEVLKTNFNIELARIYDTMLAEQLIFLGMHPKSSLEYLVGKYLHMRMSKDIATSFVDYQQEYQEYQLRYAANDVSVLRDIYNIQLPKLRQDGLMRAAKLEFDFVKPLAEMELNGMLLDIPKWRDILSEKIVERDKHLIQLRNIFEDTIDQTTLFGVSIMNFDSPIQVMQGLHKAGVDVKSTDVKELSKHKKHPIVKLLLDYRKYEKFITTYGEPMIARIHPLTGRLHTRFKQMVDTGRMSSSNPNLQNIPKEQKYRACFIAREGYKLITCLDGDSEILTINGPKKIKNISIGDKVFTHKNRFKKVLNIDNYVSDTIYEIKTYYYNEFRKITGEHPLLIFKNNEFVWEEVKNLVAGDVVCFPIDKSIVNNQKIFSLYEDTYHISGDGKIGRRKFISNHLLNKDFWRLVGYWLGDGHRTDYDSCFSFGLKDKKNCIADVCNISKKLFNYDPKFEDGDGCVKLRIGEKNLSYFLSKFYVSGNSGQKKLLPVIEYLPLDFQKELIRGYFGADGHYYNNRSKHKKYNSVGFVSISKQLLESIQRILLRFNIITSIHKVRSKGEDKILGRVVNVKDKYELTGGRDLIEFLDIKITYKSIDKTNYNSVAEDSVIEVRHGYCECGCGEKTSVYNGKPRSFIHGHNGRGKPLSYEHRLSMSKTFFKKNASFGRKKGVFKNGFFCFPIKSTSKISWNKPVFNLEVEDDHSYCLHLLTTHNCDMNAAELRIIANLSRDPVWVKIFNEGGDLHTISAASIFGISEEEVIRDKNLDDDDPNKKGYRSKSKPISFGVAYGLSEHGLSLRLGITKKEAEEMIYKYFKKYPGVKNFLDNSAKNALINKYSTSISGRRRYYTLPDPSNRDFNKIRGSIERQAKNQRIQSSNADAIKQAMIYVVERISMYDARLLLSVHDEVIIEVREDQAEEVKPIIEQSIKDGFNDFFDLVKMEAEADIADYWVKG